MKKRKKRCLSMPGAIYKCRKTFLAIAALLGLGLFLICLELLPCLNLGERIEANLTILIASLPVLFLLWMLRTHDTQENINRRALFDALKLLAGKTEIEKGFGLRQLMYLRNTLKLYQDQIDPVCINLNLEKVSLINADLQKANLQGACLYSANLRGAYLHGANLQGANLQSANLQSANLQDANLQGALLQNAKLMNANLQDANLQVANLHSANLQSANLQGADCRGVSFENAFIEDANFHYAVYNEKTRFHETFGDPSAHGMIEK